MTETLEFLLAMSPFFLIILAFMGWLLWTGGSSAIENHHRRNREIAEAEHRQRLEIITAETEVQREIQERWDKQFDKGES